MRKLLLIIIGFVLSCSIHAQDKSHSNDVKDTTDIPVEDPTVVERVGSTEKEPAPEIYDTSLHDLQLSIPRDSILAISNNGAYGYNRYLDSLLKARKHHLDSARTALNKNAKNNQNSASQNQPTSYNDNFLASGMTKIILWVLAGIFVLFVLYKLFLGDGIFKKTGRQQRVQEPAEETVTDQTDIDALINSAARSGNYRLAVRYWYLKSLHHLSGKGLLQLAQDKTNYQYIHELKNVVQRNDFAALTLNYEYVWYGAFYVDNELYHKLENNFSTFIKKV